jgi:hypothetical protein
MLHRLGGGCPRTSFYPITTSTTFTSTQVKGKSGERWTVVYRNGLQEDMTPTQLKMFMGTAAASAPPQIVMTSMWGSMPRQEHHYHVYNLQVMARDGTMRPARTVFEWVQQFIIEQCAMVIAVEESGAKVPEYRAPCEMARADGVDVPQVGFNVFTAAAQHTCSQLLPTPVALHELWRMVDRSLRQLLRPPLVQKLNRERLHGKPPRHGARGACGKDRAG